MLIMAAQCRAQAHGGTHLPLKLEAGWYKDAIVYQSMYALFLTATQMVLAIFRASRRNWITSRTWRECDLADAIFSLSFER